MMSGCACPHPEVAALRVLLRRPPQAGEGTLQRSAGAPSPACGGRLGWGRTLGLSWGRGQSPQYLVKHIIRAPQNVIVPKPKHPEPPGFQKPRTGFVRGLRINMLPAIQLHNQLCFDTSKVSDVRPNRHLAAKFEAQQLAPTQPRPQVLFGIRHAFAQNLGALLRRLVTHAPILAFPRTRGKEHARRLLSGLLPPHAGEGWDGGES